MRTPKLTWILAPALAAAWWDEGHALSTTVARLKLIEEGKQNVVDRIEEILAVWNVEFPELLGNIHYMSIWADHQKCYKDDPRCGGLDRLPGVRVFDPWHWTSVPYHPNGYVIPEDSIYQHYPLRDTGSHRLITMALRDITNDEADPMNMKYATTWSLNIHLRFLAHMYTDFHQPCHALETFAKPWLSDCGKDNEATDGVCGDWGASRWLIAQNCSDFSHMENKPHDLHNLWDAILVDGGTSWPNLNVTDLETKAKLWMADHAPSEADLAGNKDGLDIDEIQKETNAMAATHVFKGFQWGTTADPADDPWPTDWEKFYDDPAKGARCPTTTYLDEMKIEARKRVVLGGYRFANVLAHVEPFIPPMSTLKPSSSAHMNAPGLASVGALGLVALMWAA